MRAALVVLPLILAAPAAWAQEEAIAPDCQNAVTTIEINACASRDYEAADAELNRVYRRAVERLSQADRDFAEISTNLAGAVDALRKAQRAWIAWRDASCEFAGFAARGGTLENTIYIGCQTEMTRARTAELEELLRSEWLQ